MFQLVYASSAVHPMQPNDLEPLLEEARTKNDRLDITGMLLYRDGRFLQALEGSQHTVRSIYDTIRKDERHTSVITLRERLVDTREFPGWAMGFTNLDRTNPDELPEGCVPFLNGAFSPDHFRRNTGQVHQTLLQFRNVASQ